MNTPRIAQRIALFMAATSAPLLLPACGAIIDKDRIEIARVGTEIITRGDLASHLRRMKDIERPRIRNKSDLLDVLNRFIDDRIRVELGQQLVDEFSEEELRTTGSFVTYEEARDAFIRQSGEDPQMIAMILTAPMPPAGQETPLMKQFNLTNVSWRAKKDVYESQIEVLREKMQGDDAIRFYGIRDLKEGKLTLDETRLKQEYELRKGEMQTLELLSFIAIEFPVSQPGAATAAASARERIDAGESFEAVAGEYQAANPRSVSNSTIENNPNLEKFRNFWLVASGAEKDAVLGPLFLPESSRVALDAQGKAVQYVAPDSFIVLKVLEHQPANELSIEQASQILLPELVYAAKLNAIRAEREVVILEENLPDPRSEGSGTGDPVLGY